jgi:hypothetical protein
MKQSLLEALEGVLPALRDVANSGVGPLDPKAARAFVDAVEELKADKNVLISIAVTTLVLDSQLPLCVHGLRDVETQELKAAIIVAKDDALRDAMLWYTEQDPGMKVML